MSPRVVLLAVACMATLASPAAGDETRWGVTVWGVSYHIDRSIDYEEDNWGGGLRYYVARHVFVEGDLLRNSNHGLVVPVSVGGELRMFGVGTRCDADGEDRTVAPILQRLGYKLERAKTNIGLGRITNRAVAAPVEKVVTK